MMAIPTESVGSIPRPVEVLEGWEDFEAGRISRERLERLLEEAVHTTIGELEATGSPVVTDGEQSKPSFATYPLQGLANLAPDGVVIPFADGHVRQLPRLTAGPFGYGVHAARYVEVARRHARVPVKQAVISASALSLLYPQGGIDGYSQEAFLADLLNEAEVDIRGALDRGAQSVQIDFTEARLSLKLDPSGTLLRNWVALNNHVLDRFSAAEQSRLGVHTCPGGDQDATHSADVNYALVLPELFNLHVSTFYIQLASEHDRPGVLELIRDRARGDARVFVGVIDPVDPRVESAEEVRDRVLEAAEYLGTQRLGTTDDCGFAPFGDDTSTAREVAFAKIRARVEGTRLAAEVLGA
jgi:5-methyltetrahydropteroyltriglutamate--homocysteine methyltransferase